jgi:hypothetical protein
MLPPLDDAIDTVLARWFNMRTDDLVGGLDAARSVYRADIVNAVLDMPEMQAIRLQLLMMARDLRQGCNDDVNHGASVGSDEDVLSEFLPKSVIAWVLAGTAGAS